MLRPLVASGVLRVLVGGLALLPASCGSQGPRPYPCKGVLRINGKPARDARVTFYHVEGWGNRTIVPMAWTQEDGRFELSTFQPGDGAPTGDYEVAVTWPQYRNPRGNDGPDRLRERFAKPKTSTLRAHVEARENELPPFEITADVAPAQRPPARTPRHNRQ